MAAETKLHKNRWSKQRPRWLWIWSMQNALSMRLMESSNTFDICIYIYINNNYKNNNVRTSFLDQLKCKFIELIKVFRAVGCFPWLPTQPVNVITDGLNVLLTLRFWIRIVIPRWWLWRQDNDKDRTFHHWSIYLCVDWYFLYRLLYMYRISLDTKRNRDSGIDICLERNIPFLHGS